MANKYQRGKTVATNLPLDIIERLRFEAARSNTSIRALIASALDAQLPKDIKIVIGKEAKAAR